MKSNLVIIECNVFVNKLIPPNDAYMRPVPGSTFVQVMACRLFGAKPLSDPMLPYCQLDS